MRTEIRSKLSRQFQEVGGLKRIVEEMMNNLQGFNYTKDTDLVISNTVVEKINTEISAINSRLSEIEIKGRFFF